MDDNKKKVIHDLLDEFLNLQQEVESLVDYFKAKDISPLKASAIMELTMLTAMKSVTVDIKGIAEDALKMAPEKIVKTDVEAFTIGPNGPVSLGGLSDVPDATLEKLKEMVAAEDKRRFEVKELKRIHQKPGQA